MSPPVRRVKFVGDITYIPTGGAGCLWPLPSMVTAHVVVGWSMADHLRTSLVVSALDMAATNIDLAQGAIFHSDRGTQYTSAEFRTSYSHGACVAPLAGPACVGIMPWPSPSSRP